VLRKVAARVNVEILGGHNVVIAVLASEQRTDGPGDRGTSGYRQGAAFAKIVLDINDDERAHDAYPTAGRLITGVISRRNPVDSKYLVKMVGSAATRADHYQHLEA